MYPLSLQDDAGDIVLLGAPLGTPAFCSAFLTKKIYAAEMALEAIGGIPDARLAFHIQRKTASVCRLLIS